MAHFLIQTVKGEVVHDFAFHLKIGVDYQKWFQNKVVHQVTLSDEPRPSRADVIPVGALEFVFAHLQRKPKPINIPESLREENYCKRSVAIQMRDAIVFEGDTPFFVKSNTMYKGVTDIVKGVANLPEDEYLVSEVVNIESEWRCFVHGGQLLDVRSYSGDFERHPDYALIRKMIASYRNAPVSYTLDVGVNSSGTFVLEVHPFVSCGLYGFNDYRVLPQMLVNGYRTIQK